MRNWIYTVIRQDHQSPRHHDFYRWGAEDLSYRCSTAIGQLQLSALEQHFQCTWKLHAAPRYRSLLAFTACAAWPVPTMLSASEEVRREKAFVKDHSK